MARRILVVGAGLTGATIARELADRGEHPVVFEKAEHVGGFVRTEWLPVNGGTGYHHHVWGPHIFHTSERDTFDWFNRFADLEPITFTSTVLGPDKVERLMPISFHTVESYRRPGDRRSVQAIARELFAVRDESLPEITSLPAASFERCLRENVGDRLYQDCFKWYSEAFWGRLGAYIPAKIALRIPLRADWNPRYHSDVFTGVPRHGYSAAIERMLDGIPVVLSASFSAASLRPWETIYWTGSLADPVLNPEGGTQEFAYRKIRVVQNAGGNSGFQQRMFNLPNISPMDGWTDVRAYVSANLNPRDEFSCSSLCSFIEVALKDEFDPTASGVAYPLPVSQDAATLREMKIRKYLDKDRFFLAGRLGRHQYLDMNRAIEQARKLVADTI